MARGRSQFHFDYKDYLQRDLRGFLRKAPEARKDLGQMEEISEEKLTGTMHVLVI